MLFPLKKSSIVFLLAHRRIGLEIVLPTSKPLLYSSIRLIMSGLDKLSGLLI